MTIHSRIGPAKQQARTAYPTSIPAVKPSARASESYWHSAVSVVRGGPNIDGVTRYGALDRHSEGSPPDVRPPPVLMRLSRSHRAPNLTPRHAVLTHDLGMLSCQSHVPHRTILPPVSSRRARGNGKSRQTGNHSRILGEGERCVVMVEFGLVVMVSRRTSFPLLSGCFMTSTRKRSKNLEIIVEHFG